MYLLLNFASVPSIKRDLRMLCEMSGMHPKSVHIEELVAQLSHNSRPALMRNQANHPPSTALKQSPVKPGCQF